MAILLNKIMDKNCLVLTWQLFDYSLTSLLQVGISSNKTCLFALSTSSPLSPDLKYLVIRSEQVYSIIAALIFQGCKEGLGYNTDIV